MLNNGEIVTPSFVVGSDTKHEHTILSPARLEKTDVQSFHIVQ